MIFTTQINPTCSTYVLQSLQGHSDFFLFLLKISRNSESFMSFGKMFHIFGAKKETVSVPYLTELTLRLVRTLFPRKLQLLFLSIKISFIRGGESPCKNLYISVARILIFLCCIVTWYIMVYYPFQASFGKMMTCHYM